MPALLRFDASTLVRIHWAVKKNATILVVDDDRAIRQGTALYLREAGYQVLEASSGKAALEEIKGHPELDLLLTDVTMQNMDGGELAEAVQAAHPAVKILFMSGYTGGAALHDSVRDDGPAFIAKPFVPDMLLRKVRTLLKSKDVEA
jgi:CheY-like chemotaxis protein